MLRFHTGEHHIISEERIESHNQPLCCQVKYVWPKSTRTNSVQPDNQRDFHGTP
jgi:hypothetical protein